MKTARTICPQCGKSHSFEEDQAPSILKCVCKFSFRPKYSIGGASDSPRLDGRTSFVESKAEPQGETSEAPASDTEINQYLDTLRKNQVKIKESEKNQESKLEATPIFHEAPIEIEERVSIKRQKDLERQQEIDTDLSVLEESTQTEKVSFERPDLRISSIKPKQASPPLNFQGRFLDLLNDKKKLTISLSTLGGLIFLSLTLYFIFGEKDQAPQQDPYLSQLLERPVQKTNLPLPPENTIPSKPEIKTPPKKIAPTKKASLATARKPKMKANPHLQKSFFRGDFDRVVGDPAKNLSMDERAIKFEANLLSAKTSTAQKRKTITQIGLQKNKNPDSTLIMRSEALAMIYENRPALLARSIEQLKSLQLTRPRDALVYTYLGLAYQRAGKPNLAVSVWNQALTLEPQLTWVKKSRDQTLRTLQKKRK